MLPHCLPAGAATPAPCRIEIVEEGAGWPVPLIELRTTHNVRFVSDNAGVIAFDLPELMGRETWFDVSGHGYEVPEDGFGYRGIRLTPEPGGTLRVEVRRTIVARRLGRLTGGGLFAESQQTGRDWEWPESGVLGCDSVQTAMHRGRLYWLWGDTTLARYPLGIFDSLGATTPRRALTSFEPPLRLKFEIFQDGAGRPRGITRMPGGGPTWATGMTSLPNREGIPRLVCAYMKIRPPLEEYEWGLAVWNEQTEEFDRLKVIWSKSKETPVRPVVPAGHPVRWRDDAGNEWVLFGHPFPHLRCPATYEAWSNPWTWEPLTPPTAFEAADGTGKVIPHSGVHSGGIAWSAFRQRWAAVFLQLGGEPSALGELWYAEAKSPFGPWGRAVKVLSHENYTFYNPKLHPDLTPAESPILLFEGTYTRQFANRPEPTPRHDYNQMLYRLDLDDPALAPAQRE
ncbi:MAG TPA: hypothetical protein DCY13_17550 [Verrucomicrobiales bacterium]|nr:hypothetical protein [Verrucomicrobiales bacterium]